MLRAEVNAFEKAVKNIVIRGVIKKLRSIRYVDLRKEVDDLPEFWIKVFDVEEIIKEYVKELEC